MPTLPNNNIKKIHNSNFYPIFISVLTSFQENDLYGFARYKFHFDWLIIPLDYGLGPFTLTRSVIL